MADKEKLSMVDLVGIGDLLESLVAADHITCEERDRIIRRIAKESGFAEYTLSTLAGYRRSKCEVLERAAKRNAAASPCKEPDESYFSLTEIARAHSEATPGYVIQSWLRSGNTLAFLNLWEKENNPDYCEDRYIELLEKKKAASFCQQLKMLSADGKRYKTDVATTEQLLRIIQSIPFENMADSVGIREEPTYRLDKGSMFNNQSRDAGERRDKRLCHQLFLAQ